MSFLAMVTELEKKVISLIQGDLPLHPRPYKVLAQGIGLEEHEFISIVRGLKERGVIRRFGATLRHQNAGFAHNAMIVWDVPEGDVEKAGEAFAGFREVTHCYHRARQENWPYNLYTMVHAPTKEACIKIAEKMAEATGVKRYQVLFSIREFKKTSMNYFEITGAADEK